MARGDYHKNWGLSGEAQECETASTPRHAWFRSRCLEAGLDPKEAQVASYRLIERHAYPRIRRLMSLKVGEAEALYNRALPLLGFLSDFDEAGWEFKSQLLPCAENKDDHDHRPAELRGVTPDRAADRFQGSRIVARNDDRLNQTLESKARLWVRRGQLSAQLG